MLNSRDINLLRSDVAAACRELLDLAAAKGWKVLVTGTVRDDEYQLKCFNAHHSNAKTPSFHGVKAGLAFDICQNIKGHEYDNNAFWAEVSQLGKQLGFTWGGDWKSIVDKPHFQWDEHGKYTSSMIRAGKYPAPMPLLKQEEDDEMVRYNKLNDITNADFRKIVDKLMTAGIIGGDGSDPTGNNDVIDLSHDQVRTLVFTYRGGGFDKQLLAKGLEPAVK